MVLSLTQIWRIQWWCLLFLFLNGSILFMVILLQETKIGYWSWNLEPRLIRICRIRWWLSFYCFLDWKHTFWINLVRKFKHVSLSWNSTPSLFRIWKVQWWCYFLELFCKFCSKNPLKIQIKKNPLTLPD